MHQSDHPTSEISHVGVARVQACECGNLHLVVGPVSVTLTHDAFMQVAEAMSLGARALEGRHPRTPTLSLVPPTTN